MGTENGCAATAASGPHGAQYYRFQDASGRVHLVDSIDSVPQALRAHAACIEFRDDATQLPSLASRGSSLLSHGLRSYQIFGLGFAAALLVALVFSRLPGTRRLVVRSAIVGGAVALLAGAYFGWLRRTAGQSSEAFTGPSALIEDTKAAIAKMNARTQAEQAELKEIEQAK
jgi:hypothetical protein